MSRLGLVLRVGQEWWMPGMLNAYFWNFCLNAKNPEWRMTRMPNVYNCIIQATRLLGTGIMLNNNCTLGIHSRTCWSGPKCTYVDTQIRILPTPADAVYSTHVIPSLAFATAAPKNWKKLKASPIWAFTYPYYTIQLSDAETNTR